MSDLDTLPPGPEPMAPLTEERFRRILAEVVGSTLTETYEIVKELKVMVHDHEARIRALETLLLSGLRK